MAAGHQYLSKRYVEPRVAAKYAMIPSQKAIALIAQFEGCSLKAYLCPAKVPTIGYGRTTGVKMGDTCTKAQAEAWLHDEVAEFGEKVAKLVHPKTTQKEFDALVSFAYNLGTGALAKSTLLRRHNSGDRRGAAAEFGRWNKAGGRVLEGLVRRRRAEAALYASK